MKRKLLILSVLAICIATLTAGTLAYFTSEGKAHNVITTGGVEIAVQEWADEDKQTPFENLNGVMPDTTVTKIAEIRNTGAAAAWVRVQVRKTIRLAQDGKPDASMIEMIYTDTEDWKDGGDGYFYYQKALQPGESPRRNTATADCQITATRQPRSSVCPGASAIRSGL